MQQRVKQIIFQTVKEKFLSGDDNPSITGIKVEHPDNEEYGDYSTNVGLVLAAELKRPPFVIAEEIVEELKQNKQLQKISAKIEAVKPGFVNISIKDDHLIKEATGVINSGGGYGRVEAEENKKYLVEYAHPNTHKKFHIGHLRNISIGEAVARILEFNGIDVVRANYQGDVGMHIAKCLWAVKNKLCGLSDVKDKSLDQRIEFLTRAYVKGSKAYQESEQAKKEIGAINKKIYQQHDQEINKLWEITRKWSLEYFERIYERVYTEYDRYYFESEVAEPGKRIVQQQLEKGVFKKSAGAVIFPGEKYGLHNRVFISSEGNPTYEAKDMELGRLQFEEYDPDKIIHVVGPEQGEYFKVIFKALEKVFPNTTGKQHHLKYGLVNLKKGKMSSREGNIVEGEWLIDEAKKRIIDQYEDINQQAAEKIAVGAVKYSFLKVSPISEISFDFKQSISLQGNSGPYLQYTYARCQSVLRKKQFLAVDKQQDLNKEEDSLMHWLYRFPEIVLSAKENLAPNLICNYLYELAQRYNTFYNKHRILESDNEQLRLLLTAATAQIVENGLQLLGIKTLQKM
jgi:arginyl-tRNA synthetase